jgi:hypothetical protein
MRSAGIETGTIVSDHKRSLFADNGEEPGTGG